MGRKDDDVYWLYLVSRGQFASLSKGMRNDLVDRGWIEAEVTGDPIMTPLGKSVMMDASR